MTSFLDRSLLSLALGVVVLIGAAAYAAPGDPSWQPFEVFDLNSGQADPGLSQIWSDFVAKNNKGWKNPTSNPRYATSAPAKILYRVFKQSDGSVVIASVFFGGQVGCDMGSNDRNAGAEPARCPARIAYSQDGALQVDNIGLVCIAPVEYELGADPTRDNAFVAFDRANSTLYFTALRNDHEFQGCGLHVHVGGQ